MKIPQYHNKRKAIQFVTLLLIALIPILGLFRIDLASASFFIRDHQVWWSNFPIIFGLALITATVPVITYMTIGSVWCGWACPQNLLSEWANNLTYKLLGKRADARVDGKGLIVAASKNKLANWLTLGATFFAASLVLAFIPLLFFYTPGEVWGIVTAVSEQDVNKLILYSFLVFLIFIDIAFVRYFLCDYACFYRMGQKIFKTRHALHVSYDASRSAECTKCNYCAASCITRIQPTDIKPYDPCIDCGECIDACNRLHANPTKPNSGMTGLLRFEFGNQGKVTTWKEKLGLMVSRFNWTVGGFFLAGVAMMTWGIYIQQQIPAPIPIAQQLKERRLISLCNNRCEPQQVACRKGSMASCYRAAACKCDCFLEQDPENPSSGYWRKCVRRNIGKAERIDMHGQHRP